MTFISEILGRRMRLIAARDPRRSPTSPTSACRRRRRRRCCSTDRWVATDRRRRVVRSRLCSCAHPTGGRSFVGLMFGRLLAERGLQVVIQSVRGTFGSGGDFTPFDERADGLATLRWLREQPWHAGPGRAPSAPATWGSCSGRWPPTPGDELAAMAIQVSASQFYDQTYAGGGIALETAASWLALIDRPGGAGSPRWP